LRCKITGIGIVGQEPVLAALVTVENGAKLHADLVGTIADGELDRAVERTYDFLPHITLSHQPAEEAAAADLRKVRWTTKSITLQFGKRGKVHRFYLKGRRSKLRVLFKAARQFGLFEEAKHPRYPKGHPKGGRFMLTGRRAEGGEAPTAAATEAESYEAPGKFRNVRGFADRKGYPKPDRYRVIFEGWTAIYVSDTGAEYHLQIEPQLWPRETAGRYGRWVDVLSQGATHRNVLWEKLPSIKQGIEKIVGLLSADADRAERERGFSLRPQSRSSPFRKALLSFGGPRAASAP